MLPSKRQIVSHSFILVLGLVISLAAAVAYLRQSLPPEARVSPTASSTATPSSLQVGQTITGTKLTPQEINTDQDNIMKYLTVEGALLGINDNFSLYFQNLNVPEEVGIDPSRSWVPASTIKSYVVLEAFHQRDLGILDFNQVITIKAQNVVPTELETDDYPRLREGTTATVRQILESMIVQSDNTAYNTMLDILDRRNINQTLRRLSLTETVVGEKLNLDDTQLALDLAVPGRQPNTTTAKDLASFFDLVYHQGVPDSDEMMGIFKKQKINNMIPQLLPSGTVVAHKTGDWAPIYHDGGVVYKPGDPFILTIFTNAGSPDIVAKLAQVAYYQDPSVVGKDTSFNIEQPSPYQSIALSGPVPEIKVLGESTAPSSAINAADLGVTTSDLTSRDQFVKSVGYSLILPGSIFYNVKQWVENISLSLAKSNRQKSEAYLGLATSRLSEAKTLIRSGRSKDAAPVLLQSEQDLEQAVSLAKNSPDKDLLLAKAKDLLGIHYAVLKNVATTINGSKSDFINTVFQFYQKEHQNITPQVGKAALVSPSEQIPVIGNIIDLTRDQATVKLADGSEKAVILTGSVNVRDATRQDLSTVRSLKIGDHVAVVGNVGSSGKIVSRFILRNVPQDLPVKHEGVITDINPSQSTISIVDARGRSEVVKVSPDTDIRASDTSVSLDGIKVGSVVTVYGDEITTAVPEKISSSSAKAKPAEVNKSIKAYSVTVTTNSSGKKESTKKKETK